MQCNFFDFQNSFAYWEANFEADWGQSVRLVVYFRDACSHLYLCWHVSFFRCTYCDQGFLSDAESDDFTEWVVSLNTWYNIYMHDPLFSISGLLRTLLTHTIYTINCPGSFSAKPYHQHSALPIFQQHMFQHSHILHHLRPIFQH